MNPADVPDRVTIHRDSDTGQFTDAADVAADPAGTTTERRPVFYCGQPMAWRKHCRQVVKADGDRCRFHNGSGAVVGARTR